MGEPYFESNAAEVIAARSQMTKGAFISNTPCPCRIRSIFNRGHDVNSYSLFKI
jgi:hypothetical protein